MTNVEALKALYTALGGDSGTVLASTTNLELLNGISAVLGGSAGTDIASAISAIAAVASGVLPTLEDKTVTPTTSQQTITAGTGYNGLGTVTVSAVTAAIDENITAANIKSGVTILGVEGTYTG